MQDGQWAAVQNLRGKAGVSDNTLRETKSKEIRKTANPKSPGRRRNTKKERRAIVERSSHVTQAVIVPETDARLKRRFSRPAPKKGKSPNGPCHGNGRVMNGVGKGKPKPGAGVN